MMQRILPLLLSALLCATIPLSAQYGRPAAEAFAVVYTGEGYAGWSYRILPGDEIPDFELLQDGRWAFLDREINSIEVRGEMHLMVFERTDFRGDSIAVGTSIPDLRAYQPPFSNPNRPSTDDWDWSERIASLTAHAGPVPITAIAGPKHYGGRAVVFYADTHFGGSSFGYDEPAQVSRLGKSHIGHLNWNDRISSIEINGPFSVALFKNGNLSGQSVTLTASSEDLGSIRNRFGHSEGWNDDISSFRVDWARPPTGGPHTPPPPPGVEVPANPMPVAKPVATLFMNPHFQGKAFGLVAGQEIPRLGELEWGDKVSSLQVSEGYAVVLYEKGNYKGKSVRVTGDEHDLKRKRFNDEASSLRVIELP